MAYHSNSLVNMGRNVLYKSVNIGKKTSVEIVKISKVFLIG
jgi:hypothetical protein